MNKEKKHILYFDLLNIIACLCVIYMHCNSAVHAMAMRECGRVCL